jgi:NAD(P)H-flavin reductase
MGMLRQLKAQRYPCPLRLIYGNRVETQILYRNEIEALKKVLDFEVYYVLSEPPAGWAGLVGELTPQVLDKCLTKLVGEEWLFFVCGPSLMMSSVERTLIERGVPRGRIVSERFKYD